MSRGPAYDAKVGILNSQSPRIKQLTWVQESDSSPSSSEQRGRARLRGDGNLSLAQHQQQHATVGSSTPSSGRLSPEANPGGPLATSPFAHRSRSRSVAPSLPIPIPGAAGSRRAAFRSAAHAERLTAASDSDSGIDSRDASPARLP
ncbi:hypothetical protein CSUB01_08899 [Colletotrichum sublineola]|uniref:Uncharacterized protein n=1 Tax=Colletotrichum sublineola TaxID=1173701 RepID=A0A066XYG5_COLSU|nr:hypothetical protein CSUB01_08899 [Colletotrichum sublineola]